ncbi:MAG: FG-GAP-like repeat-containing protein, partial [Patescibacteria group bacterium]
MHMRFIASAKVLGLFIVAGFVLMPSVALASHTTESTTDRTATVAPGRNLPWYDRDETLGSFIYNYPIALPPGRNGMQPSLELAYNSASVQSVGILGAGWSFSIPFIERMNKTGIEDLYDSTIFTSSLSGELLPTALTDATHGTYGAKVQTGPFLSYTYDSSSESWTATDAQGTTYTFGDASSSRVDDPDDTARVFSWYISEIRDVNDNFVSFAYTKDDNQVYPSTITYTGNGSVDGVLVVTFTLESRDDVASSYASGFEVTTDQRVSAITVTVDGATRRTIALDYTTGDNGVRSLLYSILETGYETDGTTAALPETTFGYSSSTISWTEDSAYSIPQSFVENFGYDTGVRISDVNGDGLQDVLFADSGTTDPKVYLNDGDGTGWSEDTSYSIPVRFLDATVGSDQGVRLFDVNGDGFDDFVYGESDDIYDGDTSDTREVYVNDGDGTGWTQDTAYTLPANFADNAAPYYMYDAYTRLGDVNGDGLLDILFADPYGDDAVYLNNGDGTGWTEETSYTYVPVDFAETFGGDERDGGVRVADVNHDGLADLVYGLINGGSRYSGYGVYINTGDSSWTYDSNYSLPVDFSLGGMDTGARLTDVNADGFVDIVIGDDIYGVNAVYLNTGDGTGWATTSSGSLPILFIGYSSHSYDIGARLVDVDGDGLEDIVYADETRGAASPAVYVHDGEIADLLTSVTSSYGGETSVSYTSSVDGGVQENLPFILQVVESITTDDGLGGTSTESFSYEEGDFYYADEDDRQFAGFGKVTKTDGVGNTIVSLFHQGNETNSTQGEATDVIAKVGRMYREERYDSAGNLYRVQLFNWQSADLGDERTFVYLEDEPELLYDGGVDHVDRATGYTYESTTGVTLTKIDYGEVTGNDDGSWTDTGDDDRTTTYTYATDASGVITALPSTITLTDTDATTISETLYTYDDLVFGSIEIGNVTQQEAWISGTDYASTSYTYDTYGNVLTQTDPLGNTTTNVYDSYNLYPATIANALSQTQTLVYDIVTGQTTSVEEVNGTITETDYDGLDRPIEERKSSDASATTLETTKIWSYDETYIPHTVKLREYFSTSLYKETIQYLDGFDRIVETKILDAANTAYNESETTYDALGRVATTSLPEASSTYIYDASTVSSALFESYTYDALSRLTEVTNVLGTTTTVYDGFTKTVTDAVSNTKDYVTDGLHRLTSVVEYLDGTAYITTYA